MAEANVSDNNKRIAKNTMYMYLRMLVTLFISLFTARIVFNTLGVINFGIYNVVGSVIVFFSFLNNGLSLSTRRYITAELSNGTAVSQKEVFNQAFLAHLLIAAVILIVAEAVGVYIVNHLLTIPSERMYAANIVYQLSIFSALLGIVQSPFSSVIIANERMAVYAYLSIFDVIFKLVVIGGVVLISGDKLVVYAILLFLGSGINVLVNFWYCYRNFPMSRLAYYRERKGLYGMFCYMGWSLFGQGAVVLTNQGVTLLLNSFSGLIANAAMGVSNTITNIVSQFVTNFQVAFNPQLTKYYVANDYKNLYSLVVRSSRYSSFLVLMFLIPLIFQARNFLSLWLGDYPMYAVEFCILTLFAIYIEAIGAPLWMVIGSDKNIRNYQLLVSVIFLFNFIGSLVCLSLGYEPFYVLLVRVIVSVLLVIFRIYWCTKLTKTFPLAVWCQQVLVKSVLIFGLSVSVNLLVMNCSIESPLIEFLVICTLSVAITGFCIIVLGLSANERQFLFLKVKNIVKI